MSNQAAVSARIKQIPATTQPDTIEVDRARWALLLTEHGELLRTREAMQRRLEAAEAAERKARSAQERIEADWSQLLDRVDLFERDNITLRQSVSRHYGTVRALEREAELVAHDHETERNDLIRLLRRALAGVEFIECGQCDGTGGEEIDHGDEYTTQADWWDRPCDRCYGAGRVER